MNTPDQPRDQSHELAELPQIDLSEIVEQLKAYNKQFNWGHILAEQMMAKMRGQENYEEAQQQNQADQILAYENLKISNEKILNSTGLEFVPIKSKCNIIDAEGIQELTEMRIDLSNGNQFLEYLKSLDKESITPTQIEGLKEIATILISQLRNYDLEDPNNDPLLELMGNATKIIDEYKRLGGQESIGPLETYLTMSKKGILQEYREVEDLQLNKPFSTKNFELNWHIDATPEFLSNKWTQVIATLHKLYKNPKTTDLYEICLATARQAIDNALKEVTEWQTGKDKNHKEYTSKFLPILRSIKVELSDF